MDNNSGHMSKGPVHSIRAQKGINQCNIALLIVKLAMIQADGESANFPGLRSCDWSCQSVASRVFHIDQPLFIFPVNSVALLASAAFSQHLSLVLSMVLSCVIHWCALLIMLK